MKIYVGLTPNSEKYITASTPRFCCLMSYWYTRNRKIDFSRYLDFMLDSGIFTIAYGATDRKIDVWDYAEKYADYVKAHGIRKYVEMDLDKFISYDEVKKLRAYLKNRVGWDPIPVWHESRGLEDFKQMCHDYEYASIGSNSLKKNINILTRMTTYARQHGCRLHGLGYTPLSGPGDINDDAAGFYSIDSSSWSSPVRYGTTKYKFVNGRLTVVYGKRSSQSAFRVAVKHLDAGKMALTEWAKFSNWKARQPYMMQNKDKKVITII